MGLLSNALHVEMSHLLLFFLHSQVFLCPEQNILYVPRITLKHQNILQYFRRSLVFSSQQGQLRKMCKKGETTKGIS